MPPTPDFDSRDRAVRLHSFEARIITAPAARLTSRAGQAVPGRTRAAPAVVHLAPARRGGMLGPVSEFDRHRRRTERQLAVGGCLIVALGGGGLVALLYGTTAALIALAVVALAVGVGGVIWLLVTLLQRWAG